MSIEKRYEISFLFRKILVPVDGSENSLRALDIALDFAKRYGSKIYCVHAKTERESDEAIREAVLNRSRGKNVEIVYETITYDPRESSVANEILRYAIEKSVDAIIVSSRGRTLSEDINIGSTALSIVINSPVSVLVVR